MLCSPSDSHSDDMHLLHAHLNSAHATAPNTFSTCNCSMHIQHLHVLAQARPTMFCIRLVIIYKETRYSRYAAPYKVIIYTGRPNGEVWHTVRDASVLRSPCMQGYEILLVGYTIIKGVHVYYSLDFETNEACGYR